MESFGISKGNITGRGKNKTKTKTQNTCLTATPNGKVAQMLASTRSQRGAEQGGMGSMLRVRTGPVCPEDNLRVLPRDSNTNCGIVRERGKKRERERTCP